MQTRILVVAFALAMALQSLGVQAQTAFTENFSGGTTTNSWTFLNGACLTAGTAATSTAATPACTGLPYYATRHALIGGNVGVPDSISGALRFTNWGNENGAILSNFNYPLGTQGLAVSFTHDHVRRRQRRQRQRWRGRHQFLPAGRHLRGGRRRVRRQLGLHLLQQQQ